MNKGKLLLAFGTVAAVSIFATTLSNNGSQARGDSDFWLNLSADETPLGPVSAMKIISQQPYVALSIMYGQDQIVLSDYSQGGLGGTGIIPLRALSMELQREYAELKASEHPELPAYVPSQPPPEQMFKLDMDIF